MWPHSRAVTAGLALLLFALLGASCTSPEQASSSPAASAPAASGPTVPTGPDTSDIDEAIGSAPADHDDSGIQPTAAADTESALSDPPQVVDGRVDIELDYLDVAGNRRSVRAQLRLPDDPSHDPVPILTWSHGGSNGKRNPANVGRAWSRAVQGAGFAFVAVAHQPRDDAERAAICGAIGAETCEGFNTLFWDRPHDLKVVFDWIERWADDLGLDASALIHGGHSAGAVGVFSIAGAWPYPSTLRPEVDPRPIAFVAASPPGAEVRGYEPEHLAGLERPMLLLTGLGDSTASTEGLDRRAMFDLLPERGPHHLVWIDDERARHGVFNLEPASCERAGGTTEQCRQMIRSLGQAARGWLNTIVAVHRSGESIDVAHMAEQARRNLPSFVEWTSSLEG